MNVIWQYLTKMPFTFLGIIGLSFCAYMCATISWRLCMGNHGSKIHLGNLFVIRHVGEMLSVFNPTSVVAGETLKAHYLKQYDIPQEVSVSSILISRILIILSAIILMVISVIYLISGSAIDQGIGSIVVALFVSMGFAYLITRFFLDKKLYLHRTFLSLQKRIGKKWFSDKLCDSVKEINQTSYLFYKENKFRFVSGFLLSTVHWIFGAAEFYLILNVLGVEITIANAVAIEMGVILVKALGAIVPGQVGVEEYGNKIMLNMVGISSNEIWLVVSIMRRARQLFWALVAAIMYAVLKKRSK